MKLTRTVHLNPLLISIVPLVNVVFLLLAFFLLNSTLALQPGISVNLPQCSFSQRPERPQIATVTADPIPTIYFQDAKLTPEEFRQRLTRSKDKQSTIVIRADKGTPYDVVIRATDDCLAQGFSVILATADQPPNK